MTEIEKMYENAGVELVADVKFPTKDVSYNVGYPPFTAEKQLRLLKKINKKWIIKISYSIDAYYITAHSNNGKKEYFEVNNYFDEGLASIINNLWQDLTDQEKEEIRKILNENS